MAGVEAAILDLIEAEVAAQGGRNERGLTVQEAAKMLGVSPNTIYREVEAGRLNLFRVRGASRVRLSDVERILSGL